MHQSDPGSAAAHLTIDLGAIAANYRMLRALAAPAAVGGVVKADGYGLGAVEVARTLVAEGCAELFVAHLDEAAALAPALPPAVRLYVLNGLAPGSEPACARLGAVPVLNAAGQVARWAALGRAMGTRLPAAIQVDSGMARLGLAPDEAAALVDTPALLEGIEPVLLMSHLACADEQGAAATARQHERFAAFAGRMPGVRRSLANSAGGFLADMRQDLVRPGIALYGGAARTGVANPMRAVVALAARIIQVRRVAAGDGVGYGLSWTAARPSRIATVGVGYADGWPRSLGNRGHALAGGQRVPVVGRVSMDSLTLDVTDVPPAALDGAFPVELLGPNQTIDDVARDADTIAYEILTRLGRRYARSYVPDGTR